jgi:hypothetical protein
VAAVLWVGLGGFPGSQRTLLAGRLGGESSGSRVFLQNLRDQCDGEFYPGLFSGLLAGSVMGRAAGAAAVRGRVCRRLYDLLDFRV